jgi:hypothetical protein
MKACILACLVALIAVAGFAQAPSENSSLPSMLAAPPVATSPAAPDGAVFAANRKVPTKSSCTASCGSGSMPVSCSGSGSCSAVDRDCGSNERGHVTCNGVTTYCSASCACGTVCTCSAPCFSTPCDSGGGYIIDCSSWGICNSSCYCGGECLRQDDPGSSSALSGRACATPTQPDPLLAKIFR